MAKTFDTEISISSKNREKIASVLNQVLADLSDLYSQVKHAHWNVHGPNFYSLHKLFDEVAEAVEEHIDPLAERITALGGVAQGTIRRAAEASGLDEFPDGEENDLHYVRLLVERAGVCANRIRKAIDETDGKGDAVSADLLTEICADLDKNLWFLEAHVRPTDS